MLKNKNTIAADNNVEVKVVTKSLSTLTLNQSLISKNEIDNSSDYRNETNYRANSAILLAYLLMQAVADTQSENLSAKKPVLTSNDQHITLEDIAEMVTKSTSISDRNLQFISIGIREDSHEPLITTNYHAPFLFPIEVFFSKNEFLKINQKAKKEQTMRYNNGIHAETMMAAVSNQLGIEQIFVVDAKGNKVQNCIFCANYLRSRAFSSDLHHNIIQNYWPPTEKEINSAVTWVRLLDEKKNNISSIWKATLSIDNYSTTLPKFETWKTLFDIFQHVSNQSIEQSFPLLLEKAFEFIRKYHPTFEEPLFKKSYTTAKRLMDADKWYYATYHVSKNTLVKSDKVNDLLKFRQDSRLKIEDNKEKKQVLKSKNSPATPRSSRLCELVNNWCSFNTSYNITVDDNEMDIKRGKVCTLPPVTPPTV